MARIKTFRFEWTDAWYRINEGYDTILEISDSGNVTIQFLVNMKPFQLDLTDKEDEFIEDVKILKNWDKREYNNYNVLDGTMWRLHFTYDNTTIVSMGMNGYPSDFSDFLHILHQKYKVPKAGIEIAERKWIKDSIKETEITENPDIDSWATYF